MSIGKLTIEDLQKLSHDEVPVTELVQLGATLDQQFDRFNFSRLARAHFLAQVSHESGGFFYLEELGSADYFTENYEGREDLGNCQVGDGCAFKGRGYIQLTGRFNYESYALFCGDKTIVTNPGIVARVDHAIGAAFYFWERESLSQIADRDEVVTLTRRINGGENGLQDRLERLSVARGIYGI